MNVMNFLPCWRKPLLLIGRKLSVRVNCMNCMWRIFWTVIIIVTTGMPPGKTDIGKTSVFSEEYWQNVKTLWSYSSPIYFLLLTAWMSCFVCSTRRKHPPVWKKNRISHALKRTFLPCLWVAFWMTINWASLRIVLMRLNFSLPLWMQAYCVLFWKARCISRWSLPITGW